MNTSPAVAERFLRAGQIYKHPKNPEPIVPVSRSKWYAGVDSGEYPQPIKLSGGVSVWLLSELQAYIREAVEKSRANPSK